MIIVEEVQCVAGVLSPVTNTLWKKVSVVLAFRPGNPMTGVS